LQGILAKIISRKASTAGLERERKIEQERERKRERGRERKREREREREKKEELGDCCRSTD